MHVVVLYNKYLSTVFVDCTMPLPVHQLLRLLLTDQRVGLQRPVDHVPGCNRLPRSSK